MSWETSEVARFTFRAYFETLPTMHRPRFNMKQGNTYTDKADRIAMNAVASAWAAVGGEVMSSWTGEVRVWMEVHRQVSKYATKKGEGSVVLKKPDVDNTEKLVLDALKGHAWADDVQVNELHIRRLPRGPRGSKAWVHVTVTYHEQREVL